MAWIRFDDAVADDPRVIEAGVRGAGLLLLALADSNRNLRDGFVPRVVIRRLLATEADPEAAIAAATEARLLTAEEHEGVAGFRIHPDFLKLQPSRADVERNRQDAADRKARWREERARNAKGTRRSHRDKRVTDATVPDVSHARPTPPDPDPVPVPDSDPVETSKSDRTGGTAVVDIAAARRVPDVVDDVVRLWNEARQPGPKVDRLTPTRRAAVLKALKEHPDLRTWRDVIAWVNGQKWCNASGLGEHASWRLDFDFIVRPGKLTSLVERMEADRSAVAASGGFIGRDAKSGRTGVKPGMFNGLENL